MPQTDMFDPIDLVERRAQRMQDAVIRVACLGIVFGAIILAHGMWLLALPWAIYLVSNIGLALYLRDRTAPVPYRVILTCELLDAVAIQSMIYVLWTLPDPLVRTTALMLLTAIAILASTKRGEIRLFRMIDKMNLSLGVAICIFVMPEGLERDGGWAVFAVALLVTYTFFYLVQIDVAELRRVDQARKRGEADRIRTETIGRLTAGVSHDFNNLLTVIGGNIELARDASSDGDRDAFLQAAEDAAKAAGRVTSPLQVYSGQSVLSPTSVDLASDLTRLSELIARILPGDIDFELRMSEALPPVVIDRQKFETALLNLAINGQEAMPEGGQLTLTARVWDGGKRPEGLTADRYLVVEVHDTGHGIAAEMLPQVREPYVSTKAVTGGAGLGLSMVEGFMQQSGGALDIRSSPGAGTIAAMWFPIGAGRVSPPP